MKNIEQIKKEVDDNITKEKALELIKAAYAYGNAYGYWLCADNKGVLDGDIEHPDNMVDENG